MECHDLLEEVNSKSSFLKFLDALRADWQDSQEKEALSPSLHYGPQANDWENPDLGRFLEAMGDWAITTSAETDQLNVPDEPSWYTFANMLYAAKIYE